MWRVLVMLVIACDAGEKREQPAPAPHPIAPDAIAAVVLPADVVVVFTTEGGWTARRTMTIRRDGMAELDSSDQLEGHRTGHVTSEQIGEIDRQLSPVSVTSGTYQHQGLHDGATIDIRYAAKHISDYGSVAPSDVVTSEQYLWKLEGELKWKTPPPGRVLDYVQTGGIAGTRIRITIHRDGSASLESNSKDFVPKRGRVSAATIAAIDRVFDGLVIGPPKPRTAIVADGTSDAVYYEWPDGGTKSLMLDRGRAPQATEDKIRGFVQAIEWQ